MAEVKSYTAEGILELLGNLAGGTGPGGIDDKLTEFDVIMSELKDALEENDGIILELNEQTLPALVLTLAANDIKISDLNDNVLPNLYQELTENQALLNDIQTVDLPNLQQDLENNIINVEERPNVYVQPEAPTDPDDDDRYLVVGDSWFDSDDNNRQRIWNGVEWSTFQIDIPDLSVTVKKFKTSTHMIY